jgi:hypothetical protein
VDPLFENFAYIKKNHIFSLLKTAPYTNMSKCKYTYMNFPLYKQVVLSEETVFNEGEGDTDPQALHHGIHL